MQTKLVYVLTCAPEATYIEQALMAVWSARHWNPDAHIVLIVDDKTDVLLTGKRAEILDYISEKIVVPFEDDSLTPMYRSRYIKTQVRQLIKGDFLFVDCDTICQRPLNDIDTFDCEIGAVLESHLLVSQYNNSLYRPAKEATSVLGVNIDDEQYYFSSGVLFIKDTKKTHELYDLWHQYWLEGIEKGMKIDQPALAKANRAIGHIIRQIPDTYNCILFTRPPFVQDAYILHIASLLNPSFLFTSRVFQYIKKNGLSDEWTQYYILHPCQTMLPFDYNLKESSLQMKWQWINELSTFLKYYGQYIDRFYLDFEMNSKLRSLVVFLMTHKCYKTAMTLWTMWRITHIRHKGIIVMPNIMQRQ